MVSANESVEELLRSAEEHVNTQNVVSDKEESWLGPADEPADEDALAMLSKLTEKLAMLEQNTQALDADTLSLTVQLVEEQEDFKASRERAQKQIDSYRELDSDCTRWLGSARVNSHPCNPALVTLPDPHPPF